MEILIGLIIIAVGAFCQSSCYVPINKIKFWSWESYWLVQGVFAWIIFPLLGAMLAVPDGHRLMELYTADPAASLWTMFFGVLWGVGGLTFGLSMRYLGVALGQSIALGTCAGLGTILTPVFTGNTHDLTVPVVVGVVVTLAGIAVIGVAGNMKAKSLSEEEQKEAVQDFNFTKGIIVALLAGFMSACFNIGLGFGENLNFGEATDPMYRTLPATFLVTLGGFLTNAVYCFYQNNQNNTFSDYFTRGFFANMMALNVTFSNVWGIILKEWKGCSQKTIAVLVAGLVILIVSSFLPQLLK